MWLKNELVALDPRASDLRRFALVFGGALAALGALAWYRSSDLAPYLLLPAAVVVLIGLPAPRLLRGLYYAWMAIGLVLGTVVTAIILTTVFVVALTPIALVMRLLGKDPLAREIDRTAESYWIPKEYEPRDRDRLRKYF
ncbi:MAG: SxtJ family membrane protein [Thermoanaerobaculia bacterium]|nr:SxtJ family membrane protein [Thermoanaerobaculia bacterium]